MDTKKWIIKVIPVGITLILGLTSCPGPCVETAYTFAVTASLSPNRDSVKLGDTLFLHSSFPTQLRDLQSNQSVDYANASAIGSTLSVDELSTNGSYLQEAAEKFNYVSKQGRVYTEQSLPSAKRVKQLTYQQIGNNYELSVALIPSSKGLFAIAVTDGVSGSKRGQSCSRASFQVTLQSSKGNIRYIQNAFNRPVNRTDSLHFYVLKVF